MKFVLLCFSLFFASITMAKPLELVFWHAFAGSLGQEVQYLADGFNHSQHEYRIKPVYKGDYVETLTNFAAAFRAHKAPAIVQIFEVGTAMMLSPKGVIKPLHMLMHEQHIALPQDDFIKSVREFYSRDGRLMAMPFNLSVPVLFYNMNALAKVGYSKKNIPRNWDDMEHLAVVLKKAGYHCTYTSAYPGWILFESYLATHGLSLVQSDPLRAGFNTPELKHHYQRLKRWHELHYFHYGGRGDDATMFFTSNTCPLFSQSSGAYNSLKAMVPFQLGVTLMPMDNKKTNMRHANIAGGGALWAVSGQSDAAYRGIAQFFAYLAKPDVQKQWHEHTGYLPIGLKGMYADIVASSKHPALLLAKADLEDTLPTVSWSPIGPQNLIRNVNEEALEAMFSESITPEEVLEKATKRTNQILRRFFKNTHSDYDRRGALF